MRNDNKSTAPHSFAPTFLSIASRPSLMAELVLSPTPVSALPTVTWDNLLWSPSLVPGGTTFPRSLPFGEVHQWNVGVQRELFETTGLELAYVGSSARKLLQFFNPNQFDLLGQVTAPGTRPFPQFAD